MAQIEGEICEESAVLRTHLEQYGFYEFDKIAEAVQRKELTRNDLIRAIFLFF